MLYSVLCVVSSSQNEGVEGSTVPIYVRFRLIPVSRTWFLYVSIRSCDFLLCILFQFCPCVCLTISRKRTFLLGLTLRESLICKHIFSNITTKRVVLKCDQGVIARRLTIVFCPVFFCVQRIKNAWFDGVEAARLFE